MKLTNADGPTQRSSAAKPQPKAGVIDRKLTFQDEFRLLQKRYELAYDEWYVWD